MESLKGLEVVILVKDGFEQSELSEPRKALDQAGAITNGVSPKSDRVRGWNSKDWGAEVSVDVAFDRAQPQDFDALLPPGGVINLDALRMQPKAVELVKAYFDVGKPVAVICHGPWTVIEAGAARGRRIAAWPSLKTDLRNAGAEWVDQEVVVQSGLEPQARQHPGIQSGYDRAVRQRAPSNSPGGVSRSPKLSTTNELEGPTMGTTPTYKARQWNMAGLKGISDKTLEMHFKLYEGYVSETNRLTEHLTGILKDGQVDQEEMPAYSELTRRLGFEYNGMVLHEYYFDNLTRGAAGEPNKSSAFARAAAESFGSFDVWKTAFVSVGKMRGVGWAICYQDPHTGKLSNHWVTLHEVGNVAGFIPILVMDVWEHAFILDYAPAQRPKYIEAFLANTDWDVLDKRLAAASVHAAR